ncbi:MAG: S-methyl-5-thioribose-1-phosphate isomerase [Acaryochloris sp. SU_5_25]|nr:S-methyl-5-thioribose-1-phosphate isomerase [Acaryochloris sp. SU_5_25]
MTVSVANPVYPVVWRGDHVELIDQTRLPQQFNVVEIRRVDDMAIAIQTMIVRGAPAIGVAAAFGLYLGSREIDTAERDSFLDALAVVADKLKATRPTAVNLGWAVDRMLKVAHQTLGSVSQIQTQLLQTAQEVAAADLRTCQAIGEHGLSILPPDPDKICILTHCNAGALATAGYGTALGVVRSVWSVGRLARVYADETRPRLQGAKLTTWECVQEGIPVTLLTDGMAAHCMQQNLIDLVVVGADRIAANGDTANKIGTYSLALAAQAHHLPFYVAAPLSTIDFDLADGQGIPIEERHPSEIYQIGNTDICPGGVEFYNPAFDVTPAELITGIITEHGVFQPSELQEKLSHHRMT